MPVKQSCASRASSCRCTVPKAGTKRKRWQMGGSTNCGTEPMEVDPPAGLQQQPMEVDQPKDQVQPMEVDPAKDQEEPMEVDPPSTQRKRRRCMQGTRKNSQQRLVSPRPGRSHPGRSTNKLKSTHGAGSTRSHRKTSSRLVYFHYGHPGSSAPYQASRP